MLSSGLVGRKCGEGLEQPPAGAEPGYPSGGPEPDGHVRCGRDRRLTGSPGAAWAGRGAKVRRVATETEERRLISDKP